MESENKWEEHSNFGIWLRGYTDSLTDGETISKAQLQKLNEKLEDFLSEHRDITYFFELHTALAVIETLLAGSDSTKNQVAMLKGKLVTACDIIEDVAQRIKEDKQKKDIESNDDEPNDMKTAPMFNRSKPDDDLPF